MAGPVGVLGGVMWMWVKISFRHLHLGHFQSELLYISQKKKKQYIDVGTVRMFIEPSAK